MSDGSTLQSSEPDAAALQESLMRLRDLERQLRRELEEQRP